MGTTGIVQYNPDFYNGLDSVLGAIFFPQMFIEAEIVKNMRFFRKRYRISMSNLNELNPEETLFDSESSHSKMEIPINRTVFNIFFFFVVGIFGLYMFNVFQLQIVNGEKLSSFAKNINSAKYFSVPIRGVIFDNQNRPFVENVPTFDLIVIPSELTRQTDDELNKSLDQLSQIIKLPTDLIEELYAGSKNAPIVDIKNDLSKEEVLKIEDLNLKGFYVAYNLLRSHDDGIYSAHLIGYTSKVTPADIKNDPYYQLTDRVGRYGLEAQYEDFLRGERRNLLLGNDPVGQNNSKLGDNLYTSADKDIQKHLYQALIANGVTRGAAVIQNPKTGEVLGLVSIPSFNNDEFESGQNNDKLKNILEGSSRPLFNRVISGKYSPGSTIKPLLALAGLKEGVVTSDTKINATGSITVRSIYDPNVAYTFNDWKIHGVTDIRKAISDSVDVYFYILGGGYQNTKGLGIEKIVSYFKSFLLDKSTGIDLPGEVAGFIPSPAWKQTTRGESWYIGDTYNISIGQGDLGVTPITLNTYIGSIANGGKLMKPYIVKKITDSDGNIIKEFQPQVIAEIPFDPDTLKIVREGMRQTITSGTASLLNNLPVQVAAKTGTAQTGSSTSKNLNSLFTVFGPYDDPTITMTILVENIQSGQGAAIKVANTFLSWYFSSSR